MITAIGVLGVGILLILFILNQIGKVKTNNLWYDLGNFIGAVLLTIYAYLLSSIPFFVLEGVWALFSLKDVVVDLRGNRK